MLWDLENTLRCVTRSAKTGFSYRLILNTDTESKKEENRHSGSVFMPYEKQAGRSSEEN